ncbi:MAG: helix-turn-helix transcriptional regulator [Clostridia bacterium]|nr:helix-turn-helix transcriptional regulator [Clostridia bacterium]
MIDVKLYIDNIDTVKTPPGWYLLHKVKMQRLYYIKGGTGTYCCDGKMAQPFEKGKIYLFPYNVNVNFNAEISDPIDHIYFDFVSTPPIIAKGPVICDVKEGSALHHAILLADELFGGYDTKKMTAQKIPHITSSEPGSFDEQRQTVYQLLRLILLLLSAQTEIPYSMDEAINDTVEYIRKNYMKPITIAELSTRAGLAENYFIRRFKSVMGQTPYAYLKSHRLLCASELIAGGISVAKASEMVGYEKPSSLSRAMGKRKKSLGKSI